MWLTLVDQSELVAAVPYFKAFAEGNTTCCLSNEIDAAYKKVLIDETMKAMPAGLAALMVRQCRLTSG